MKKREPKERKFNKDRKFDFAFRKLMREQEGVEELRNLPAKAQLDKAKQARSKLIRIVKRTLEQTICVKDPGSLSASHRASILTFALIDIFYSEGLELLMSWKDVLGGSQHVITVITEHLQEGFSTADHLGRLGGEEYHDWIQEHLLSEPNDEESA